MYFDNVVFDPHLLRYLITTFGETQICVGSDYPFRGGQKNSAAFVEALQLPVAVRDDILYNNAARFLNLEPAMLAHAGA
jgi:aminocarboxymuconate-semialdehyde decarboxylase